MVHELGHFIAAKLSGVKVEGFSVGFGPELAGFTRGDTRYSLRIVPLGGYVKMLGEEPVAEVGAVQRTLMPRDADGLSAGEQPEQQGDKHVQHGTPVEDSRSFSAQPFRIKALILAAGSAANVLLALILFVGVFQVGATFPAARIGTVEYGLPAFYAGLKPGDRILQIDGRRNVDFEDLQIKAALTDVGAEMELLVERDNRTIPVRVCPEFDPSQGISMLGVENYPTLTIGGFVRQPAQADDTRPREYEPSPAEKAGVEDGWTISAVNGQSVESWGDFSRAAVANGLRPLALTLRKDGVEKTVTVIPTRSAAPFLGISPLHTTEITEVKRGSQADRMGLRAEDTVVSVGERKCGDLAELRYAITSQLRRLPPLVVLREGRTVETAWDKPPLGGVDFCEGLVTRNQASVAWVVEGSAAEVMGLARGDSIVSIDQRQVTDFESIRTCLRESKGDRIKVVWKRGEAEMEGEFQPVFVGIVPMPETITWRLGIAGSCQMGLRKAWDAASQIYILLRKAVTGEPAVGKKLSGPVGLAYISYQYAKQGFTRLVFLLAVIGLNLGVVNLLPIPILDGGLLAVCLVEKIRGKRLSLTTQAILQYVGLALIVALFIYVTWQDILRVPWPDKFGAAWRFVLRVLHLG